MTAEPLKILISKPGLDGHDKGAKLVALALNEAGMNVIYTGLHQHPDQIIDAACKNDVDAIGLSIMTGAHLRITRDMLERMEQLGLMHIKLFVGGVIPKMDIDPLKRMGASGVFPGGTSFADIEAGIRTAFGLS